MTTTSRFDHILPSKLFNVCLLTEGINVFLYSNANVYVITNLSMQE